jgi:hypothetical protein
MHESLQDVFRFPEYYGKNLDALWDCMTDLLVPKEGGVAIVLNSYDVYTRGPGSSRASGETTAAAQTVLDIMASASRVMLLTGKRLITLVQSDDPRMQFGKLGGVSAEWNKREWLNRDRAL